MLRNVILYILTKCKKKHIITSTVLVHKHKQRSNTGKDNAMQKDTILIGGYAQYPVGVTGHEVFKVLGIGLEIDTNTGEVINATASFVTEQPIDFLKKILIGKNIRQNGIEKAIEEVSNRYFAKGKKAIIAALYDVLNSYSNYEKGKIF